MTIDRRTMLRLLAVSPAARIAAAFAAGDGEKLDNSLIGPRERIVFFGDSITQGGTYVAYLETLLRLRFPDRAIEIHNHGVSSETISGTSEPDHDPRRPWAHDRFTRDVADWHPTILVSCFGMNDGNYHPFDEARFEKYRAGIHRLIERTRNETGVKRLILCTPPPFDPYQRKNGDPRAIHYGYKYPAVNYDETLRRYSEWLLTLREQGQTVIDLHTPLNRHLAQRRQQAVSFTLMPDAVHPDATGHAVLAITLAKQLGLNGPRDTLVISEKFDEAMAEHGSIKRIETGERSLNVEWHVPPRWSFGPGVDSESLSLESVAGEFDSLQVRHAGLGDGKFELTIENGTEAALVIRQVHGEELRRGIRIEPLNVPGDKAIEAGEQLARAVMTHRQAASARWRERAMKLPKDSEERGPTLEEIANEAAAAAELSRLAGTLVPGTRLKIRELPA